jgi:RNA polymerase sigma factor (sigma-70 family)
VSLTLVKMNETDGQLLARYAQTRAEDAFGRIVQRHVGLVYSAALRQIRSPQLGEEIAQNVFIKLARHAAQLAPDTVLTAWLYQVTHREAIDVGRREIRRQLREQIATEMNAVNATNADWTHVEPLLDEAMRALDDTDRTAVLLRYFENKTLREVGATLGTSENAAQKRLTRAMERLREFFVERGVTIGVSALVLVVSANAVQATPIGLIKLISAVGLSNAGISSAGSATTLLSIVQMTAMTKTKIFALAVLMAVLLIPVGFHLVSAPDAPKSSVRQDFLYFTNLSDVGFATPEAAVESWHEAIMNQGVRPITPERMKDLWNLPDDYDDPTARYAINTGKGFGGEIGYRISNQSQIASNQVQFTIEYEKRNGSLSRDERTWIKRDGHWRLQPVRIKRQGNKAQ